MVVSLTRASLALSATPASVRTGVSHCVHSNGMCEVRLEGGQVEMYDGLAAVLEEHTESEGLVLRIGKAAAIDGLPQLLASQLKSAALQATLRRWSETRPVISIAEDCICGAAACLWMVGSQRVCTSNTLLSLPECRVGLCPTTAPALGTEWPHMAMFAALTGAQLNPHDCMSLRLATHFTSRDHTLDLVNELRFVGFEHPALLSFAELSYATTRYCPAHETAVVLMLMLMLLVRSISGTALPFLLPGGS